MHDTVQYQDQRPQNLAPDLVLHSLHYFFHKAIPHLQLLKELILKIGPIYA